MLKVKVAQIIKLFIALALLILPLLNISVQAQTVTPSTTGEGSLSINPTSATFNQNQSRTFSIVYTGDEITAAHLAITVGGGLQIVSMEPGEGLVDINNEPENGIIDVGKLSDGNITSGSTLATVVIQATGCNASGIISFDQDEVLIPDIELDFSSANYTINCTGGASTPTNTPRVSSLPNTSIGDTGSFDNLLFISALTILGGITLRILISQQKQEDSVQLITRNIEPKD